MDNNLEQKLWQIANELRGNMDSSEFKNYILGFLFYRFLSEKVEEHATQILVEDGLTFEEAFKDAELAKALEEDCNEHLGYYIDPNHLFQVIIKKCETSEYILDDLVNGFKTIEQLTYGTDSYDDVYGLFSDINLEDTKLGRLPNDRNTFVSKILKRIAEVEYSTTSDNLGNAYEYLLKMFASDAGKKGGEFYTPSEVSTVVAKLVTANKEKVGKIYDPTCGSGSLLLKAYNELDGNVKEICGQELNSTTFNLCRMNMFLHGLNHHGFKIKQGDTLEQDQFDNTKFDLIVANPPFGTKWKADAGKEIDPRFAKYGKLAPKSHAEMAFLQHMLHHLTDDGVMATVVPHGVLFRGNAELAIRKYMIETDNVIDCVVGLPANLFYGTGIPACIIVFKKCRNSDDDILFIDASNDFEKVKTQNILSEEHINKIINTYINREEIDKYSRKISLEEIQENEYNLNIPRYIDTFEEEEPIDIDEVNKNIAELEIQIANKKIEIEAMLKELGLE